MKCAYSACVCAIFIATANVLPVYGGELDSATKRVQTVQQFNELLNQGEFDQAENIAKESFLRNSSDPLAVLMLRQVLLTRKGQPRQIVFPVTETKSRVITPSVGGPAATCGPVRNCADPAGLVADSTAAGVRITIPASCGPATDQPVQNSIIAGAKAIAVARSTRKLATSRKSAVLIANDPFGLGEGLDIDQQFLATISKSCTGACLQPLNAAGMNSSVIAQAAAGPGALDEKASTQVLLFTNSSLELTSVSDTSEAESTISLHLIKGPANALDRLGISIQSETSPHISQPKLNAAKDALPTPITVPVLTPATEKNADQPASLLVPLIPHAVVTADAEVSVGICVQRERVIRHIGEPLATRRLSPEERQEILKAAQAADRVSLTTLPKLTTLNDQEVELSNSIIDSEGKVLQLGLHSYLTSDKRAVNLRLDFHSDHGPAALTQRITLREFLESEEALLIALDAPIGSTGLETAADAERQTTYLVISPKLRTQIQQKVAAEVDETLNAAYMWPYRIQQVTATRKKVGADESAKTQRYPADLERRVYPVADLVIPVPNFVSLDGQTGKQIPAVSKADFKSLIEKITSKVSPDEWEVAGGPATIKPFETTMSLVVRATLANHEMIKKILDTMRRELDIQAVVEVRIVKGVPEGLTAAGFIVTRQDTLLSQAELDSRESADDAVTHVASAKSMTTSNGPAVGLNQAGTEIKDPVTDCEACQTLALVGAQVHSAVNLAKNGLLARFDVFAGTKKGIEFEGACESALSPNFKLLTTAQQEFLWKNLQGINECEITYAPKVTLLNGQTACIQCEEELSFSAKIDIGSDRKLMITKLQFSTGKASDHPFSFQGKLKDGESLLLPITSNQDLTSKGKSPARQTYLMVTPRVIIVEEQGEVVQTSNQEADANQKNSTPEIAPKAAP